jgi:hypothetical protein
MGTAPGRSPREAGGGEDGAVGKGEIRVGPPGEESVQVQSVGQPAHDQPEGADAATLVRIPGTGLQGVHP